MTYRFRNGPEESHYDEKSRRRIARDTVWLISESATLRGMAADGVSMPKGVVAAKAMAHGVPHRTLLDWMARYEGYRYDDEVERLRADVDGIARRQARRDELSAKVQAWYGTGGNRSQRDKFARVAAIRAAAIRRQG